MPYELADFVDINDHWSLSNASSSLFIALVTLGSHKLKSTAQTQYFIAPSQSSDGGDMLTS